MIQPVAVYVLWLREMKKFVRAKSRVVGAIAMPAFMLVFLGLGFRRVEVPGLPESVGYLQYLVPGILGMTLLFTGAFVGMSVLMDRQFGFLKEVMVTPASRVSIVLGRISGGATTSIIQALMMLFISVFLGFHLPSLPDILISVFVMLLISIIFICIGLILSSVMKDMHGFNTMTNFIVFPIFLLSGALFPVENLPAPIRVFSYIDPLTYGVDALRGLMIGYSAFPLGFNLTVLVIVASAMIWISSISFKKSKPV
ncbi:ABC transporter permease [Methanoplanus limicola]|uniref:ABC-2 type transporter n=1 Tax=Methanoplanus limicola DSM 2279 TaxID=937775 RepID=H1Z249_9EURY|nr:ABC transporter permease [Methanoplanus limicola]EHQ36394.1 ABC-2 type transporter [Methanoplanus limicola DSM 2279]